MILADTSVWVDHLARGDADLFQLLDDEQVLAHPFVTAELALGSLARRRASLRLLDLLPRAPVASQAELMMLIERESLAAVGIGFVDAHLLASCRLAGTLLWTRDKRLGAQARRLGCAWTPAPQA